MEDKMSILEKLMAKKKPDDGMDENYRQSKMDVLKQLHSQMGQMMADDLHGLKKVTVASPDKEGLKMGLQKAEDLVGNGDPNSDDLSQDADQDALADDHNMQDASEAYEGKETPEEEQAEDEAMSPEEIDAKIKVLEALKAKKSMKA